MTSSRLPPGLRPFALADIQPQPWRNGGGHTREILLQPAPYGAGGDQQWDWRLSVADIGAEGAFSVFPGIDRTAALLRGPGLALQGPAADGAIVFARIGDVRTFPGEAALQARLPGGPARLLNAMARRGRARAGLAAHAGDAEPDLGGAAASVLFVLRGGFSAAADHPSHGTAELRLGADAGLCITDGGFQRVRLRALQPGSLLVQATFGRT